MNKSLTLPATKKGGEDRHIKKWSTLRRMIVQSASGMVVSGASVIDGAIEGNVPANVEAPTVVVEDLSIADCITIVSKHRSELEAMLNYLNSNNPGLAVEVRMGPAMIVNAVFLPVMH